ncbi:hypothetical protein OJ997_03780 [Solirubrobacter phytolaccae]|uniref:PPIase cyclophilin-type domain-containing protein n=1 Tax=Solirubrobacter phytolaccae TaxID=1404360 RepID=A0A9X3S5X6_9ACTN|nr:hypothetical protein [Solirubrobacter phytolaccae]MDA0179404.1 hypothetical protein [Solirubrobacter phytolaccae]
MRSKILAGLTAVVAAATIAAPAHAATTATTATVSAGKCKVRYSDDTGKRFTYAQCVINVSDLAAGQTVKVNYESNLKTFNPHSEIGPFRGQTGTVGFSNVDGQGPADLTQAIQIAFKNQSVAQIKKQLKVTLSSPTKGVVVSNAVATA